MLFSILFFENGNISNPNKNETGFLLIFFREYDSKKFKVYHFDMYRITSFDDLCSTGFFDYLDNGSVLAIEWSENIENALPEDKLIKIEFFKGESDDERIIRMSGESVYEDSWR